MALAGRWRQMVLSLVLVLPAGVGTQAAVPSMTACLGVRVEPDGGLGGLTNRLTGAEWLNRPSGIYRLTGGRGLAASVHYTNVSNTGEVRITLTMLNPTDHAIPVAPTFPCLDNLDPAGDYGELRYCFPEMGKVSDAAAGSLKRYYGGDFPLQFMDVYDGTAGGIYVMTQDLSDAPRTYHLDKTPTNAGMSVVYSSQTIPPGGNWSLTAVIGAHQGDWHAALSAYRAWVATWYSPVAPRKPWFQDVYNLRQIFLYSNPSIGAAPAYDPSSHAYCLEPLLARDKAAFGGVDYVHLFDWSQTPSGGRVGDYNPWDYLGGAEGFSNQLAGIQSAGVPVGLYFEGYLISTQSAIGRREGASWELLNAKGRPYANMGANSYYMDPEVPAWADYLADRCLSAVAKSAATGVYLDEFGFGWQYPCFNPGHDHGAPGRQVRAEGALMRKMRLALPPSKVLYSEERNTDVNSQFQDGSFTYSVSQSRMDDNPSRVNLARFALPDYKLFEIIRVDAPLGNDPGAVTSVFFNGEGIWLEGPLNDRWFPTNVCRLISHAHSILRRYAEAFRSVSPVPLVATLNTNVYANQFPGASRVVWTLYNAGEETVRGEVLSVPVKPGRRFYDAWNDRMLTPRINGASASLSLDIPPGGAGCIVEEDFNAVDSRMNGVPPASPGGDEFSSPGVAGGAAPFARVP